MQHLEAQANVLARKEFGYLESWTKYPNFTTNGEFWANLNVNSQALHPVLKRQDRLGKEPFAGFGTVVEVLHWRTSQGVDIPKISQLKIMIE